MFVSPKNKIEPPISNEMVFIKIKIRWNAIDFLQKNE